MTLYAAIERATGVPPIVVDSDSLKRDPEGVLRELCARIGTPFRPEQLSWAPGLKVGWMFVVAMVWAVKTDSVNRIIPPPIGMRWRVGGLLVPERAQEQRLQLHR